MTCEEEEAIKDPSVRKMVKDVAAEVEKMEGRGQLKVSARRFWIERDIVILTTFSIP